MEKKPLSYSEQIRKIVSSNVKTYSLSNVPNKYMFIWDVQKALEDRFLPTKVCNDVRRLEEILMASGRSLSKYSETLANLPNEVQFSDYNLKYNLDEIHYDADKKLLIWKGGRQEQMSEWAKECLLKLSNDNHYQKAVERLFEKSKGIFVLSDLAGEGIADKSDKPPPPEPSYNLPTGIQELDRVLGKGFHVPSSIILAGDPGVGKSTLMLLALSNVAKTTGSENCIYFSAEQDISQIEKRVKEMNIYDEFNVEETDDLEGAMEIIKDRRPKLVVVDSIKRMRTTSYKGTYDSPHYVSYCGKQLAQLSKKTRSAIVLINHMTKKGDMAGLKTLEHDVDVVLYLQHFQENTFGDVRMLYASKNRYGATEEYGFFKMTEKGLIEHNDVESLFRPNRQKRVVPGVSLSVVKKGQRILPIEVQASINKKLGRRINAPGLNKDQVEKILGIMEKWFQQIDFTRVSIQMTTAGELELNEPSIQLAMFAAIMSEITKVDMSKKVFIGEVDLKGYVRFFSGQKRLLNSILRIKNIDAIFAPIPEDPSERLEDAKIIYIEHIYQLIELFSGENIPKQAHVKAKLLAKLLGTQRYQLPMPEGMKSYEIRFNKYFVNKGPLGRIKKGDPESGEIQCSCYFKIANKKLLGKPFSFKIHLNRLDFTGLYTNPRLRLKREDAKWVLLKYGLEKTKRTLNEGVECNHSFELNKGDLSGCTGFTGAERKHLKKFEDKLRVETHDVKLR